MASLEFHSAQTSGTFLTNTTEKEITLLIEYTPVFE